MYKQWTTGDNKNYMPAGEVVKEIPAGYYQICNSMAHGTYFSKKDTKQESLIRFPDASTDLVIEEIEKFWALENRFREENLPYKRGIMMYGPPGSGKTCTLRIVAENLIKEHNGMVVDFPGIGLFKEGYEILRSIHKSMPLIVFMEDVDSILSEYNSSETLNLLDGMYNMDKIIFVATTNYPEKLGSRVMNRPSRFDKKIFVGMPSEEARKIYIESKLKNKDEKIVSRWVEDTDGFSIAHIKELFIATEVLGEDYDSAVKVLSNMKNTPISNSFDPHALIDNISENSNKLKDKCNPNKKYVPKPDIWEDFNKEDGTAYKKAKKIKANKVLNEDRIINSRKNLNSKSSKSSKSNNKNDKKFLSPSDIADMIED